MLRCLLCLKVSVFNVYLCGLTHTTRSRPPFGAKVLCVCVCVWPANSHRPVVQDGPAVGADACPSARVDTFAPVSLVQEGEMCHSVLATLPDRSTWCDKPTLPPPPLWPSPSRVGRCPGRSRQPATRHSDNSRWATGEPPSCPGRTELVQSGGGGRGG